MQILRFCYKQVLYETETNYMNIIQESLADARVMKAPMKEI